jgi:hypothetical protein
LLPEDLREISLVEVAGGKSHPYLPALQIEKAKTDAQRRRAEADVGPVRYLAERISTPTTDLKRPVRLLTLRLSLSSIRWRSAPACRRHTRNDA